jgi:hypothetical protein
MKSAQLSSPLCGRVLLSEDTEPVGPAARRAAVQAKSVGRERPHRMSKIDQYASYGEEHTRFMCINPESHQPVVRM